jgi:hypothetical protein
LRIGKYKNIKTEVGGYTFDSKKEAKRYGVLRMMVLANEITNLRMQVKFELLPNQGEGYSKAYYVADFVYEVDGDEIVEDVKGVKTPIYQLKKKLMKFIHNIVIYET